MAEETKSILGTDPTETTENATGEQDTTKTTEQTTTEKASEQTTTETAVELSEFAKTLPESLQGDDRLKDATSIEDVVERLTKPAEYKDEEYEVPETAPSNVREFAKKLQMSPDQLKGSIEYWSKYMEITEKAKRDAFASGRDQLFESWGEEKESNLLLAQRARQLMDPDGSIGKILDETGWGDNPVLIEGFRKVGNFLKEGGFIKSSPAPINNEGKSFAQILYPDMPSKDS